VIVKINWIQNKLLTIVGLVLVATSCGNQAQVSTSEISDPDVINLYSLDGHFDVKDTEVALKASTVNYTFSNGTKLTLHAMDRYFFVKGADTSVTLRSELPNWINDVENQLKGEDLRPQGVGMSPGATHPASGASTLWPSAKDLGVIYYEVGSFPTAVRTIIGQAIAQWNNTSVGVKWRPRPPGDPYRYATIVGGNNNSLFELFLGTTPCGKPVAVAGGGIGYNPGDFPVANTIYLNSNCFSDFSDPLFAARAKAIVMHEMGHVTGLWHEQQRCGRGNYVTVASGSTFDPVYFYNSAEKCNANAQNYGYYDFTSIMHYGYSGDLSQRVGGPANSNYCGDPTYNVGRYTNLSPGDINAINRLYNRGPISTTNGC
jgi:hypothetical protein